MVTVDLIAAVICFQSACFPALVGPETPRGIFKLEKLKVVTPKQYGGDVMMFKQVGREVFAVHRTWPGREPKYALAPDRRRLITLGCINVEPSVYDQLVKCCDGETIEIK